MQWYRCMLSLLILSIYLLFLLHDFIPHTHVSPPADDQIASWGHHSHGEQRPMHSHQQQEESPYSSPGASHNNPPGNHLIPSHNHSIFDSHQHDLTHPSSAQSRSNSRVDVMGWTGVDHWHMPDRPDHLHLWQSDIAQSPPDSHLAFGNGLRAPPVLG